MDPSQPWGNILFFIKSNSFDRKIYTLLEMLAHCIDGT